MSEFIAAARNRYSLAWNPDPPVTIARLVAVAVATGVYTALSALSVIALPIGIVGVSSLFIGIGFGIPFGNWFGAWGLLIGYIGTFLGASLPGGIPWLVAIPFSFVDWFQLGIPMLAYRALASRFGVDPMGKDIYSRKGFAFFVVFGGILPNAVGALYGLGVLSLAGLPPENGFWPAVFGWWAGNLFVSIIIAPILLRGLSSVVERYGLTSHGLIT